MTDPISRRQFLIRVGALAATAVASTALAGPRGVAKVLNDIGVEPSDDKIIFAVDYWLGEPFEDFGKKQTSLHTILVDYVETGPDQFAARPVGWRTGPYTLSITADVPTTFENMRCQWGPAVRELGIEWLDLNGNQGPWLVMPDSTISFHWDDQPGILSFGAV